MSALRLAAICLAILALTSGVAGATHSPGAGGGPPKDFVVGGGHHSVPDTQFTISAHSGALGENPKGHMSFKIDGQERFHVDVTCLIVVDNEAIATGVITRPQSAAGQLVVMHAVDNGEPDGVPLPDLLRFSFTPDFTPFPTVVIPAGQDISDCLFPTLAPVPVTQGNIVVHDALP